MVRAPCRVWWFGWWLIGFWRVEPCFEAIAELRKI